MKLLYERLNQASLLESNRFYTSTNRKFSRLEPRRSNPLDQYQLLANQWQIPTSKPQSPDYPTPEVQLVYNQSYLDNEKEDNKNQDDSHVYNNVLNDEQPAEQYLQVDPRCYVRQKSNLSLTTHRRSELPRLEKGHSINVDTRPSATSASLSPYRQSSFDVALDHPSSSIPSPGISSQQEIFFTPRGSSLSVFGHITVGTPPGSQHLSPPISFTSRQNSVTDKKDLSVTLDASGRGALTRSAIVQREHEHFHSLEHSIRPENSSVDKQSRSFDAVQILRPVIHREDAAINRRTKSYEYADDYPSSSSIAPPPIVIKIPDMRELDEYQQDFHRISTQSHRIVIDDHTNEGLTSNNRWQLHQSYDDDERQQLDGTSPDELSPDLLTSTSIDSAGAMAIHQTVKTTNNDGIDEDLSKYEYRRKSSSNLLLPPPPEVRRQALRRTFEKRRRCIDQSNARREQQQLLNNSTGGMDDDYDQYNQSSTTIKSTDFSSLLNNFNSKSENSSFDRSLETDFDVQSDASSRGANDHFTSIESSGNENVLSDVNQSLFIDQHHQQQQHDSGYKSLENQYSQNHRFSLDWISADGVESVIYVDQSSQQQRNVDLNEEQILNNQRLIQNFHPSLSQEMSINSDRNLIEQRGGSLKINPKLVPSTSFIRTASKRRKEFGKDKRYATSNTGLPYLITTDEQQFSSSIPHPIQEMNMQKTRSSTLQVRHLDFRRSKSDEGDMLEFPSHSIELNKTPTQSPSQPIRLNFNLDSRHTFQRSPSSTTPPVALSPQIVAFRSKRGSISFDNPISPIHLSRANTTKPSSPNITKPRLKFSMVRDTTTSSLGSTSPNYSMGLAKDFTIDEKTNQIINEFLMQDNHQQSSKHPHQQIRQKTFDETLMMNNSRTPFIQQRQHSFIQPNTRQHTTNTEYSKSPLLTKQSDTIVRRDNAITISSPSIIVTGYDSSS